MNNFSRFRITHISKPFYFMHIISHIIIKKNSLSVFSDGFAIKWCGFYMPLIPSVCLVAQTTRKAAAAATKWSGNKGSPTG